MSINDERWDPYEHLSSEARQRLLTALYAIKHGHIDWELVAENIARNNPLIERLKKRELERSRNGE
jgi:hypothetical protein